MRILLVKLNHLGDTLLLTPTIRALADKFPGCRIDVMVRSGTELMLEGNPHAHLIPTASPERHHRSVGRTFSETRHALTTILPGKYDYAFDLTNSDRGALWCLLSGAPVRAINTAYGLVAKRKRWIYNQESTFEWGRAHEVIKDYRTVMDVIDPETAEETPGPLHFYTHTDAPRLQEKLPHLPALDKYIVIHPTSRWAYKQWIPERWSRLADRIARDRNLPVIFSCGPAARETAYVDDIIANAEEKHFTTAGKTSIHDLAFLLGQCTAFIGVDTVAMHLAAAMQAKTVALFGPSSEWSWHPWQTRHELVLGPCECKIPPRNFVCKEVPYPCVQGITEDAVAAALDKVLDQPA